MTPSLRPSRSSPLRTWILTLLGCGACNLALAAAPPATGIGKVLACRTVAGQAARLQCFDRAAAVLAQAQRAARATVAAESSPAARANPAATAASQQRNFGLSAETILAHEVATGARPRSISGITARITGLHAAADGRMIYQLDDGQTWEELVNDGYGPRVKPGDRVRISRGWLDSYWLQAPSGRGCKVQRLR